MNDDGMILEDVTTLNVKRMFTASRIHLLVSASVPSDKCIFNQNKMNQYFLLI